MRFYIAFIMLLITAGLSGAQPGDQYSWRYYTCGNTGILGDYSEALWIDYDGDPYIAAYTPGWEEGGFSKYIQSQNLWINYSNVEYPVIGSIYDVGSSRISDIAEDADGNLWMATWRGILKFDPEAGGSSLQFWGAQNSPHPGGRTVDIDIAPDGTVWAAVLSVTWGDGGLVRYDPANDQWQYWGYGITANGWPAGIPFCEHLSIQLEPGGEYTVWIDGWGFSMITYSSMDQLFTELPQLNEPGEVASLPGKDCMDEEGNLWALRVTAPGQPFSLDYRQPNGTWITPAQPVSVISDIWAFRAFGNHEALITGLSNEIFQFGGNNWSSKGIWRDGAYTYDLNIDAVGNIWVCGIEGAAKRDAGTGDWQRHRITNSSQIDYWVSDLAFDDKGNVWMTGNAGPGVGGFQKFDGTNWTGFNEYTYGMGYPFPFPTDNVEELCFRPSTGDIVINPMYNNLHSWDGSSYQSLNYNLSRSKGLVEDSQGRLWSLGEYYSLEYYNDNTGNWTDVPFISWGSNIMKDPSRAGTVWACASHQVLRTDGSYNYSKIVDDFPELDPQSDMLSTVVPGPGGEAWVGSNKGLFHINSGNDTYQFFSPFNSDIPGESITPLAYTPDGRIWFTNFGSTNAQQIGLCWFDGTEFGIFPVQDGGLPHAQISDIEINLTENGYELWISCLSRGIAVLQIVNSSVGIKQIEAADQVLMIRNYPNPFRTYTDISFSLPEKGSVKLDIFDSNGKAIRTLIDRQFPSGASAVRWNGENDNGKRVSPGFYLGRITTSKSSSTVRIVVL